MGCHSVIWGIQRITNQPTMGPKTCYLWKHAIYKKIMIFWTYEGLVSNTDEPTIGLKNHDLYYR